MCVTTSDVVATDLTIFVKGVENTLVNSLNATSVELDGNLYVGPVRYGFQGK